MEIKAIEKTHVKQLDQSDCGVACLSSIIQFYGGRKELEQLRDLSGTSRQGTTLLGLYQAAPKCGFEAEGIEADIGWLKKIEAPVILHVLIDKRLQHYMVCYGYENGKFIIGDPARGVVEYLEKELEGIWQSKALLSLKPTESFEKVESVKDRKKEWFKELIKPDYGLLAIIFALSLAISILGITMAVFSQKLIDDILPSKNIEKLVVGIVFLTVLLVARGGIGYLAGFFAIRQGRDFNNRLIGRFYGSLLYLPKSFFDNRRIGELVARMNDTSRIQSTITSIVGDLLKNFLFLITGEVVLFVYSPVIGLLSLVAFPVFGYISYRYHKRVVVAQKDVMAANAHKSSNYINTMQGIDTVKSGKKEEMFAKVNQLIYGHFQDKVFHLGKLGISLQMSAEIAGVLITIAILATGSWMVLSDGMTLGELMAILGITGTVFPAISSLAFANITLQGAKVAFDRMFEFTSIKPEFEVDEKNKYESLSFETLEVKKLSFRFPGRKALLNSISFSLKKGEVIALLGESGGGKTTILNILQKFYAQESGSVLLNGQALDKIKIPEIREFIGVVPQEVAIFNGTLLDNITLEADKEVYEKCIKFCKEKGFEKYFNDFPQSYGTILGEEGINISGGQKQLIGLCRALFRNPQLLLLDEPTSAMDKEKEDFALSILNKYRERCGIIVVTHQLKIARMAHRVYVLKEGKIQAKGEHQDLMQTDNLYSMMYHEIVEYNHPGIHA